MSVQYRLIPTRIIRKANSTSADSVTAIFNQIQGVAEVRLIALKKIDLVSTKTSFENGIPILTFTLFQNSICHKKERNKHKSKTSDEIYMMHRG